MLSFVTKEIYRLRGKTLGIIGFGKVGRAVCLRAKPFGFNITFYDPYLEDGVDKSMGVNRVDTLKELMSTSDVICVHCFLDKRNYHMINEESLSWVKPGSFFVNTARLLLRCKFVLGCCIFLNYPLKGGDLWQNRLS